MSESFTAALEAVARSETTAKLSKLTIAAMFVSGAESMPVAEDSNVWLVRVEACSGVKVVKGAVAPNPIPNELNVLSAWAGTTVPENSTTLPRAIARVFLIGSTVSATLW